MDASIQLRKLLGNDLMTWAASQGVDAAHVNELVTEQFGRSRTPTPRHERLLADLPDRIVPYVTASGGLFARATSKGVIRSRV
jgi:hypothetical protein